MKKAEAEEHEARRLSENIRNLEAVMQRTLLRLLLFLIIGFASAINTNEKSSWIVAKER